jgi:hypothetical protein
VSKSKLDDAATERIFNLIRAGNTLEVAAAAAGIHRATLHRWMKYGKEQERGLYRRFMDEVEKAKADAEARDVALIAKAATADWRAAAWRLERRSPRRYGQKVQISVQAEFDAVMDRLERAAASRVSARASCSPSSSRRCSTSWRAVPVMFDMVSTVRRASAERVATSFWSFCRSTRRSFRRCATRDLTSPPTG